MRTYRLCFISEGLAFFTTNELSQQWGDDWNDAPYEHNAGEPYKWREGYGEPYHILNLYFTSLYDEPCEGLSNSPFSVEQINQKCTPWLTSNDDPPIYAGETLAGFIEKIKASGGDIYMRKEDWRFIDQN